MSKKNARKLSEKTAARDAEWAAAIAADPVVFFDAADAAREAEWAAAIAADPVVFFE